YNGMHVTALCSPTRAALLTGRNHHSVGFGSIGELPGPFPGYSAVVPKDSAPFPKVLQLNGYSTCAIGKWHLSPSKVQGPAGPVPSVRPVAERMGLRLLLGLPHRRVRPVRPDDLREQQRRSGLRRSSGPVLLPTGRDDRQGDRVAARDHGAQGGQAVVHVLLD